MAPKKSPKRPCDMRKFFNLLFIPGHGQKSRGDIARGREWGTRYLISFKVVPNSRKCMVFAPRSSSKEDICNKINISLRIEIETQV